VGESFKKAGPEFVKRIKWDTKRRYNAKSWKRGKNSGKKGASYHRVEKKTKTYETNPLKGRERAGLKPVKKAGQQGSRKGEREKSGKGEG